MTNFAGLGLFLDIAQHVGLIKRMQKTILVTSQGWSGTQIIIAVMFIALIGGNCIDDIETLENDSGLRRILVRYPLFNPARQQNRWRVEQKRVLPSAQAIRRFLGRCHSLDTPGTSQGEATIIPSNNLLQRIIGLNRVLIDLKFKCRRGRIRVLTLDQDATFCPTNKRDALRCYKGTKAYQALNTYCPEMDLIVHTEFREGNVNPGYEQTRCFKEALGVLSGKSIERLLLRSDAAGYQVNLMKA